MKSFGPLLRKLRGRVPLTEMARRLGISKSHLANLEAGRKLPDEDRARDLLCRGFDLAPEQITRLLLDVQLMDYGLRGRDLRQLVIDLIRQAAPSHVRRELRRLYRSYAGRATDRTRPDPS